MLTLQQRNDAIISAKLCNHQQYNLVAGFEIR